MPGLAWRESTAGNQISDDDLSAPQVPFLSCTRQKCKERHRACDMTAFFVTASAALDKVQGGMKELHRAELIRMTCKVCIHPNTGIILYRWICGHM